MQKIKYLLISMAALVLLYIAGPTPPKPHLDESLPKIEGSIENYVSTMDNKRGLLLRPGCEAKILWANDSTKQVTEYVLLYLHGFSASRREGYPVNEDFASHYGCNAFLARLASHGENTDTPLLEMTPERLYESAKEALVVASQLGRKVIIMGCSTGCTLALKLAADFPGKVDGLILYSPNVQIKQKSALLLSRPWGLQIAQMTYFSKFRVLEKDPGSEYCKYWNCRYRVEAIVYLQQFLDVTMKKEVFAKVTCPVFLGYYFKDEQHQDQVVEVKAALRMFDELGTADEKKRAIAFPEAGNHVITCDLTSGAVPAVRGVTYAFAEEVLAMKPFR